MLRCIMHDTAPLWQLPVHSAASGGLRCALSGLRTPMDGNGGMTWLVKDMSPFSAEMDGIARVF